MKQRARITVAGEGSLRVAGERLTAETTSPEEFGSILDRSLKTVKSGLDRLEDVHRRHHGDILDRSRLVVHAIQLGVTRRAVITEEAFWADMKKQSGSGIFTESSDLQPEFTPYWDVASRLYRVDVRKFGNYATLCIGEIAEEEQ